MNGLTVKQGLGFEMKKQLILGVSKQQGWTVSAIFG
jgi:hypothetical protein